MMGAVFCLIKWPKYTLSLVPAGRSARRCTSSLLGLLLSLAMDRSRSPAVTTSLCESFNFIAILSIVRTIRMETA